MKVEFTKEECQAILQFIDLGVKQVGLPAVNGAFVLQAKLNKAMLEDEKQNATDPATGVQPAG